jgi:hypothetical protein
MYFLSQLTATKSVFRLQYLQCKDAKLKVLNLKSIIAPQKEIEDI